MIANLVSLDTDMFTDAPCMASLQLIFAGLSCSLTFLSIASCVFFLYSAARTEPSQAQAYLAHPSVQGLQWVTTLGFAAACPCVFLALVFDLLARHLDNSVAMAASGVVAAIFGVAQIGGWILTKMRGRYPYKL